MSRSSSGFIRGIPTSSDGRRAALLFRASRPYTIKAFQFRELAMNRLVIAFLVLVATSVSAFAQGLPIPSYWLNQRGSEMKLYAMEPNGTFTGVYINHAAGFACQNIPYNLAGRAWADHSGHENVLFGVVWTNWAQDCHSKTLWRGHLVGHTLWTEWILIDATGHVLRGRDAFQLQP